MDRVNESWHHSLFSSQLDFNPRDHSDSSSWTYSASVADRLRIKTRYDYVYIPRAVARIEALELKLEAYNLASEILAPGDIIDPGLISTVVDTQMMLAMNSSLAKHEAVQ